MYFHHAKSQLRGLTNCYSRAVRNNEPIISKPKANVQHPHNHWKHSVHKQKKLKYWNMKHDFVLSCNASSISNSFLWRELTLSPGCSPPRVINKNTHTFAGLLIITSAQSQLSLFNICLFNKLPFVPNPADMTLPKKTLLNLLKVGENTWLKIIGGEDVTMKSTGLLLDFKFTLQIHDSIPHPHPLLLGQLTTHQSCS